MWTCLWGREVLFYHYHPLSVHVHATACNSAPWYANLATRPSLPLLLFDGGHTLTQGGGKKNQAEVIKESPAGGCLGFGWMRQDSSGGGSSTLGVYTLGGEVEVEEEGGTAAPLGSSRSVKSPALLLFPLRSPADRIVIRHAGCGAEDIL